MPGPKRRRPVLRTLMLMAAALLLAPITLVTHASPASACSCAMQEPQQHLDIADVVVTGTVIDTDRTIVLSSADPVWYLLEVDAVYKGEVTERVRFSTPADTASCGAEPLSAGPRYVVFLLDDQSSTIGESLSTNLCLGTGPYDDSGGVAALLAQLDARQPEPGGPTAAGHTALALGAGIASALVLVVVAVAIRVRRRRQAW